MRPVSMLMSNLNIEANTHHAPNALAAAQDTGQSQEIIREGIKVVQTVQANEAAAKSQRVRRKTDEEKRDDNNRRSKNKNFDFYAWDYEGAIIPIIAVIDFIGVIIKEFVVDNPILLFAFKICNMSSVTFIFKSP